MYDGTATRHAIMENNDKQHIIVLFVVHPNIIMVHYFPHMQLAPLMIMNPSVVVAIDC